MKGKNAKRNTSRNVSKSEIESFIAPELLTKLLVVSKKNVFCNYSELRAEFHEQNRTTKSE